MENTKFCPMIRGNCIKEKCAFWVYYDNDITYAGCDYCNSVGVIDELEGLSHRIGNKLDRHNELLQFIAENVAK